MFVSILLLSLFGTSSASSNFSCVDNSRVIVEKFLDKMIKTIETRDSAKISDLFMDDFFFYECDEWYDKKKMVAVLSIIPSGLNLTYKDSWFIPGEKFPFFERIDFYVSITGFNPTSITRVPDGARFMLNAGKLEKGKFSRCLKFHGFVGSFLPALDDIQTTVEKFLTRMVRSIESKNLSIISGLFKPDFVYKMCTRTYGKTQVVVLWSKLPAGNKFGFTLKSVEDLGSSIKFLVSISGFRQAGGVSEYVLNKSDLQLDSGRNPNCLEMIGRSYPDVHEDSDFVIQRFLALMKQTIASYVQTAIEMLFDDNFSFKGCKKTYTKAQAVEMIIRSPSAIEFELKSSKWNRMGQVEYTVTITRPMDGTFDAQFVFCPHKNVLKSGKIASCPAAGIDNFADLLA